MLVRGHAIFALSMEDHVRALIGAVVLTTLAGCESSERVPQHADPVSDTQECQTYRAMITALMEPRAHERLKLACENSRSVTNLEK